MKNRFELFVVFHENLKEEYYDENLLSNYIFVNVNPKNDLDLINPRYKIINQYEINNFIPLGKFFAESEVIFNIYKNKYLYENVDYLGFLQHDIDSSSFTKEFIDDLILNYDHINLQPYLFEIDYGQKILMDESQPNKKTGRGINCYDVILNDYNSYYGTNYKLSDLSNKNLNLCSSFILKKEIFIKMMEFVSSIIESNKLDKYDTQRQHRIQGGYLERYYAVWLALNIVESKVIKLEHHFAESIQQNSFFYKLFKKIGLK